MSVRIVRAPLTPEEIQTFADAIFGDMIKVVVDVKRELLVAGITLHADGEEAMVQHGSARQDLWGANYFPNKPLGQRVEYTSMINQCHTANKGSQTIKDPAVRARIDAILERFFGGAQAPIHKGLTPERWNQFPMEQRLLMVASECARAGQLVSGADGRRDAGHCVQRARELLRWTMDGLGRAKDARRLVQRLEAIVRDLDGTDVQRLDAAALADHFRRLEQAVRRAAA